LVGLYAILLDVIGARWFLSVNFASAVFAEASRRTISMLRTQHIRTSLTAPLSRAAVPTSYGFMGFYAWHAASAWPVPQLSD
jgi:hypothetical protein